MIAMKKIFLWTAVALGIGAGAYGVLLAHFYGLMKQPPLEFATAWDRSPALLKRLVPMPPLWKSARRGRLDVGDTAPDFELETPGKKRTVRLSDFVDKRPVVLVFGSYT